MIASDLRSFLVRYYFAVAATVLAIAIAGAWVWAKDFEPATAAQILGAVASVVAAIIALVIAEHGARQSTRNEEKKAAAAAILVSDNVYFIRNVLDVIHENRKLVLSDPDGYAHWLSSVVGKIIRAKPIIEDRHLAAVVALPTLDLYTLAVADSWLKNFQARFAFREGITVAEVISKFDNTVGEILNGRAVVVGASDRMFDLSGVGGRPPWEKAAPSWVTPTRTLEPEHGR